VKDDSVYLQHIVDCIQRIEEDTAGGYDFFMTARTHQDAVMRNLQVMAESTQRLTYDTKAAHPHMPWQAIAGFRNILVHAYLGIDLDIIWDADQRDLPVLKQVVSDILAKDKPVDS
jgi:uncharacterized protein with HEPN domain